MRLKYLSLVKSVIKVTNLKFFKKRYKKNALMSNPRRDRVGDSTDCFSFKYAGCILNNEILRCFVIMPQSFRKTLSQSMGMRSSWNVFETYFSKKSISSQARHLG